MTTDTKAAAPRPLMNRIAEECIRLADECEHGTAPCLIAGDFGTPAGRCAAGWVLARVADDGDPWTVANSMRIGPEDETAYTVAVRRASRALITANNYALGEAERRAAVISPLRALAATIRTATEGSP